MSLVVYCYLTGLFVFFSFGKFVVPKEKDSSEVNTEDAISFYKYFNFTMLHANEEIEHSTYYILEIHINNSIVRGRNAAEEYLNHSCLMAMIDDQNECMNVSLQLKSYVECKL